MTTARDTTARSPSRAGDEKAPSARVGVRSDNGPVPPPPGHDVPRGSWLRIDGVAGRCDRRHVGSRAARMSGEQRSRPGALRTELHSLPRLVVRTPCGARVPRWNLYRCLRGRIPRRGSPLRSVSGSELVRKRVLVVPLSAGALDEHVLGWVVRFRVRHGLSPRRRTMRAMSATRAASRGLHRGAVFHGGDEPQRQHPPRSAEARVSRSFRSCRIKALRSPASTPVACAFARLLIRGMSG